MSHILDLLPEGKKIILFDGMCNLCDQSVQFIIEKDADDVFRFVSLQSALGQEILNYIGIDTKKTDSIVLYEPGIAYYTKAEAAIEIASHLNSWHKIIKYFKFTGRLGNVIYDYIAKNRYRWYGKKVSCMVPTPELQNKFL